MTDTKSTKNKPILRPQPAQASKIEKALKIREETAAARKGKPLAFPSHRAR